MKKTLNGLFVLLAAIIGLQATAAIPTNYYNSALGKADRDLMVSLHQIINGHYEIYYNNLWEKFKTTDCNGNTIIDRYSDSQFTYSTDQCGTGGYNSVGDCYNREHSVPNSWWGGNSTTADTMYTDLFHMYPTDGFVNGKRANFPFGDCANGTQWGTGKLGACTHSGYTGTVFEVADEYKGDFARTYFYMVVRYMDRVGSWTNGDGSKVFTNSTYKHLTPWAISQLLAWHRNDPVSDLETRRNEAVYGIQHNRNPFIDHPELAEFLWGNNTGAAWTGSATNSPIISTPSNGSTINVGTNTGEGVSKSITVKGVNLTKSVTVAVTGTGFSVTPTTLTAAAVNAGTTISVTYNGTTTNATGRLTISSTEITNYSVTLTATYNTGGSSGGTETVETWEGCATGGYWTQAVQGHAFSWNFTDAGIWADTNRNGALSCRFGKNSTSTIEMTQDLSDGVSKISFYAAKWSSSEANPTLQVQYSTNGGSTWSTAGSCTPTTTWQQYIFNTDVHGDVRIRIKQSAGARLNIDDIAITSNPAVVEPTLTITAPGAIDAVQGDASPIVSGTVLAENNAQSITLTVDGNFELSLNKVNWANTITLDPTGETYYVRLKSTAVIGSYEGSMVASVGNKQVYADVHGAVHARMGDVNMDGSVGITDVTDLIDYLLGNPTVIDEEAADLSGDHSVGITDVTELIDILLNPAATMNKAWDAMPTMGGIFIENQCDGEMLEIYDMDGNCKAVVTNSGNSTVELPAGIYLVSGNTRSRKVVVK